MISDKKGFALYFRPFLCFSLFCVQVGIEPRKLQNKQRKISIKNRLFMDFYLNSIVNAKVLVMFSINLVIIFYFTLCSVFLLLITEIDKFFVMFDVRTTCTVTALFFEACLFFPLAGG
jgi:hypothetical protein